MSDAAVRFGQRILLRQMLVNLAGFCAIAIFAPKVLLLEWEVALGVLTAGLYLTAISAVGTAALSFWRLRAHRFLLRSLALGSAAVEPEDLGALAELPRALTFRFLGASSLSCCLLLSPGIRPDKLDDGRAVSLIILAITLLAASAIPHYVLVRQATLELLERAPLEPLADLLGSLDARREPWRRVGRRLLIAVALPVALVGVGALLVSHAHLRALTEQSRRQTALLVARIGLEPLSPGRPGAANTPSLEVARAEAIAAAARLGFKVGLEHKEVPLAAFERDPGGDLVVTSPLDDGQATVRFEAELDPAAISVGAAAGILAVVLAALLGNLFGRALADDLVMATRSVRLLGTDSVLRGSTRIARPARFAVVAKLGRAIEELTERFRVFAAAQERALEAREAAQRMRGLLFASVSHDLKSPLNAILGFAELVGREPLSVAQRESLSLITRRGRELLGLIETILDAARVEAGQLTLAERWTDVPTFVHQAVRKARELAVEVDAEVEVEILGHLPELPIDQAYATRALAVVVAHALRAAAADPDGHGVRVTASLPERPGNRVRIDVAHGAKNLSVVELEALFARLPTARARGLTLGLSLARSVIELHGGLLQVFGVPHGAPVCRAWFPLQPPGFRPRLSSIPTLG